MSGRLASQGSTIMISDGAAPTSTVVTAATKAKPCVLTITTGADDPVVGDIVVPRGTGWNSIEGMPWKVSAVAAGAVTLEDTDTTNEVSALAAGATVEKSTFLELCRSNFTANSPAGATVDVTTLCDLAHRIVPGLPAISTWTAAGFYDCSDTGIARARDAYRTGDKVQIDVRMPDGCGFTFMGIVNTFDVTLGVNAAITNSIGGQVDGGISFYKTPAVGFVAPAALRPPPPRTAAQPAQVAA
jgi:hypothetical protein